MSKKIKINIPNFGEIYCSDNVEYKLFNKENSYIFYKKQTHIQHNEYGPAYEIKNINCFYLINNKFHRLNGYAYHAGNCKSYDVIGKFAGNSKEEFIKNLSNVLIPKNNNYL